METQMEIRAIYLSVKTDEYTSIEDDLGTFTDEYTNGCIDRTGKVPLQRHSYRYFKPMRYVPHDPRNWEHVEQEEKARLIERFGSLEKADAFYALEDWKRAEAFIRNEWSYFILRLKGCISINGVEVLVESEPVGGIESDFPVLDVVQRKSIVEEMMSELVQKFQKLGIPDDCIMKIDLNKIVVNTNPGRYFMEGLKWNIPWKTSV